MAGTKRSRSREGGHFCVSKMHRLDIAGTLANDPNERRVIRRGRDVSPKLLQLYAFRIFNGIHCRFRYNPIKSQPLKNHQMSINQVIFSYLDNNDARPVNRKQ